MSRILRRFFRLARLAAVAFVAFDPGLGSAIAAPIVFDFEGQTATAVPRTGALSSLSITQSGLTIDITRPGGVFDIVSNTGLQTKPSAFGQRSVDPFIQETTSTPLIVDFQSPVRTVAVDMGDYGQDAPDILQLEAYSGLGATGSLLAAQTRFLPTLAGDVFNFRTLSTSSSNINSVRLLGGTPSFPNSVFYDNIQVTPDVETGTFLADFAELTNLINLINEAEPFTVIGVEGARRPHTILLDILQEGATLIETGLRQEFIRDVTFLQMLETICSIVPVILKCSVHMFYSVLWREAVCI